MTRLITIHKGLVFTIVLRMTNDYDLSQDLTQDAFIKVFMNIKRVKGAAHFKPWICTITRNVVRDHFRKAKRTQAISFENVKDFHVEGKSNIDSTRRRIVIQGALAKLAERDRMILTLTYYEGLSLGEVAQALKMSENAVKVGVHRARKRLRKYLEGYEHELMSIH
ncbi:MAG: sigma-70 family RNA polymerase sigma factor, partial [candidate division WOR-3 bacterium]